MQINNRAPYPGQASGVSRLATSPPLAWQFKPVPTADSLRRITIDPSNDNIWYLGSASGLYITRDAGNTWEQRPGARGYTDRVAVDPNNPRRIYSASDNILYRSNDKGVTWSEIHTFPDSMTVKSMLVSRIDSAVFIGNYWGYRPNEDPGLYKSVDHGMTWTFCPFNIPALPDNQHRGLIPWDIAEDEGNGFLYVPAEPASKALSCDPFYNCYYPPVLRSKDRGQTWQNISGTPPRGVPGTIGWNSLRMQVNQATHFVYYQSEGGGVSVSENLGDSWKFIAQNFGFTLLIDPKDPTTLFSTTDTGIIRESIDGAHSFNLEIGPPAISGIRSGIELALNHNSTKLYAACSPAQGERGVYVAELRPASPQADLAFTTGLTITPASVIPGDVPGPVELEN